MALLTIELGARAFRNLLIIPEDNEANDKEPSLMAREEVQKASVRRGSRIRLGQSTGEIMSRTNLRGCLRRNERAACELESLGRIFDIVHLSREFRSDATFEAESYITKRRLIKTTEV